MRLFKCCAGAMVVLAMTGGASAGLSPAALRPGNGPVFPTRSLRKLSTAAGHMPHSCPRPSRDPDSLTLRSSAACLVMPRVSSHVRVQASLANIVACLHKHTPLEAISALASCYYVSDLTLVVQQLVNSLGFGCEVEARSASTSLVPARPKAIGLLFEL